MGIIFEKEVKRAIKWLYETQNSENFGWSWVADISPNAQNTSEVVYALSLYPDKLGRTEREFLNEAVEFWLLYPSMHSFITIDWVWNVFALVEYKKHWDTFNPPELAAVDANYSDYKRLHLQKIDAAINHCVKRILENQNDDGGWADYRGDHSTVVRTSLVVYMFSLISADDRLASSRKKAVDWLLQLRNPDGGWGNIRSGTFHKSKFQENTDISLRIIDEQFLSSASATGYAILALASIDKFFYRGPLLAAEECLVQMIRSDGRYDIFYEVGIKRDTVFTFRHFGTVWANLALLSVGDHSAVSEQIIRSVKYLLSLQDTITGGFRCSEGSDVYTWSTCNALIMLKRVGDALNELAGTDYIDILVEYIKNKSLDNLA